MLSIATIVASMFLELIADSTRLLLTVVVTLTVTFGIIYKWRKIRNTPPGPVGIPFFGYLPFLGKEPHKTLQKLSEKYGGIFSIYFGPAYCIVVSDYEIAKDVLSNSVNLARPLNAFDAVPGSAGFGGANGEEWQEQRRFSIFTMRNLGLGRGAWETLIQQDAEEFVEEIKSWAGKASDFIQPLALSQNSNIIAMLIGKRLPKDGNDPEVQLCLKIIHTITEFFRPLKMSVLAPSVAKQFIKFGIAGCQEALLDLQAFGSIISKEVTNRINSNEKSHVQDFIGCYLEEMEKMKISEKKNYFSAESLIGNIVLLFVAGIDSTLTSLNWLLRLMASHPEIQKKVHNEIDEVLGRDGQAYWDDRNKLPYTIAAMLEMQRWATISPLFPARLVTETFEVSGYTIPKGSRILTANWTIMHDPKYHKNPHEYMPERFLENDGKKNVKVDGYIPFSFGKRNCPGETVAMMTLYLYFIAVMQKFNVVTPDGKMADLEPQFGAAMRPKRPQQLCFIER